MEKPPPSSYYDQEISDIVESTNEKEENEAEVVEENPI